MTKLKKILLQIVIIISVICLASMSCVLFAGAEENQEETLEEKLKRFTSSDILDGESELDLKTATYDYRNGAFGLNGPYNGFVITEVITKIIPEELFYTPGTYVHVGTEYAIVMRTIANSSTGNGWVSWFIIVDFNLTFAMQSEVDENDHVTTTDIPLLTEPKYEVEILLNRQVQTLYDSNDVLTIVDYNDYCNDDTYVYDVGIGTEILNESETNIREVDYVKSMDDGKVIENATLDYYGIELIENDDSSSSETIKFAFKAIVVDGIDLLDQYLDIIDVPVVSNIVSGANFVISLFNFKERMDEFEESVRRDSIVETRTVCTEGTSEGLEYSFGDKADQINYVRYLTIKQDDTDLKGIKFVSRPNDSNGNISNSRIGLSLNLSEHASNTRVSFAFSFKAVLGDYVLVVDENGNIVSEYEQYDPESLLEITNSVQYSIKCSDDKYIKHVGQIDNGNDNIADDPMYILDRNGYALYKFEPLIDGNNAFGYYKFTSNSITDMEIGTRIFIFNDLTSEEKEELANMTVEEIVNHPKLFAKDESVSERYGLIRKFNVQDTYYVMFKYAGQVYESHLYYPRVEFAPTELVLNTNKTNQYAENETIYQTEYYSYTPTANGVYTFHINNMSNCTIKIYDKEYNEIETASGSKIDAILKGGEKYYFSVSKNSGSASVCNVKITNGNSVNLVDYNYSVTGTIANSKKVYYKFTPENLSGKYKLTSDGNLSNLTIKWYDSNFNVISNGVESAFLSRNSVYYISLENHTPGYTFSDTIMLEYQNNVLSFNAELTTVYKDEIRQEFNYVLEVANRLNEDLKVTVTVYQNGTLVSTLCQNVSFTGDVFSLDLSNFVLPSGSVSIRTSILVNDDELLSATPINITNNTITDASTLTVDDEYCTLEFSSSSSFASQCIEVTSNVKVLVIKATLGSSVSGLRINIQYSQEPLVIYIKNVQLTAPTGMHAITSQRDIILNIHNIVVINGGAGRDNMSYPNSSGKNAIYMRDNALIINGNGRLILVGGNGGDTADGVKYSSGSDAGYGGNAIEVGDFVINVGSFAARGGNGGKGGCGMAGANGADGVGQQSSGVGNHGSNGYSGEWGCGGGIGGTAIWTWGDYFRIYTTNISISGGNGGDGGTGGKGGDGGDGAPGESGGLFGGQQAGGNGGNGAIGGTGGDAGNGMIAYSAASSATVEYMFDDEEKQSLISEQLESWGNNGSVGVGGAGGLGGQGGAGGTNTWGVSASDGADGADGPQGADGVIPPQDR